MFNYSDGDGDTALKYELWRVAAASGSGANQNSDNFDSIYDVSNNRWFATSSTNYEFTRASLNPVYLRVIALKTSGTRYYRMRAHDGKEWSDWSDVVTVNTTTTNSKPIVNVSTSVITLNSDS